MRKPFVAGNWKMNLTRNEAVALATGLAGKAPQFGNAEVGVIPAFVHIDAVRNWALKDAGQAIGVGAQDAYFEKNGAFTGEVSTAMLSDHRHALDRLAGLLVEHETVAGDTVLKVLREEEDGDTAPLQEARPASSHSRT